MSRWLARVLACFAAVAAVAGCTDSAVVGNTDPASAALCGQCADGTQCSAEMGKCVMSCMTARDCGDSGTPFCDPNSLVCSECRTRDDCDHKLACIHGACSACSKAAECGDQATCDDAQCQSIAHSDSEDVGESPDGGGDAGTRSRSDAGIHASSDAGIHPSSDAGTHSGSDAGGRSGRDSGNGD